MIEAFFKKLNQIKKTGSTGKTSTLLRNLELSSASAANSNETEKNREKGKIV